MPIVFCFGLAVLFQLLTVAGIETSKRNQRRQPVHADPGIRFVTKAGAPCLRLEIPRIVCMVAHSW